MHVLKQGPTDFRAYSEPCQISKVEHTAKIVND